MKIRMRVDVSGVRDGQDWPPRGEVVTVSDGEGAELCAAGIAEPVASDHVETAVEPAAEERDEQPAQRGRPKLPRDDSGKIIRK